MPKDPPGLTRRGNTYEVRFRVPNDIRATFKTKEVVKSLRTRDHAEARRLYFDAAKTIHAEFDKHRIDLGMIKAPVVAVQSDMPKLTAAARRKAASDHYARRVDEERLSRHARLKAARRDPQAFWNAETSPGIVFDLYVDGKLSFDEAFYRSIAYTDAQRRERLERAQLIGDCDNFIELTDAILDHDDRVKLALDIMAAELRALRDLELPSEPIGTETATAVQEVSVANATPPSTAPQFDAALKSWLGQNSGKRWTAERKKECEGILLDFAELVGKQQIDKYTGANGRAYRDALTVLPSSWRKRKDLRGLSVKEAAERAPSLEYKRQSVETINGKLTIVAQFFNWCKNEYDEWTIVDPVANKRLDKDSNANEEVDPFTVEQLNAIFQAPPFTGAKSDRFWQEPGPIVLRDSEKFWLPILALWTGARLGELCQLTDAHIREYQGVHYFAFTREMRLKKNPKMPISPGVRNVPIHAVLIEIGFLEFVATRKGRLFPDLPMHSSGRYSDAPSKWFQRFLKAMKIKQPKIKFHSFRHNFIAAAKRCGLDSEARERLVGHVLPGEAGRYGDDFVAEQQDLELMLLRNAQIQKVSYAGLSIEHLKL